MNLNITDAIFSRAELAPHAVAVIDAERTIDYRTLCQCVCLAAHGFAKAGWKPGDIVGISLRGSPSLHLISSLALARMGITQASVPSGDPLPLRLLRIGRLGLTGLVVDHDWVPDGTCANAVTADAGWLTPASDSAPAEDIRAPGDASHWIINETSGTTATPKLIGVSHAAENEHRRIVAPIFAHLPGERFLNLTGMRFLTALKRAICCLSDGGTLTLAPPGLSTDQLLNWIERYHVTYLSCVPVHLYQLLRDINTDAPRLPSLRILRSSSSTLPVSAVRDIRRRICPNLYINYGVSEAGPIVAATPAMLEAHPDTVGMPLDGVEFEIVDDNDKPMADGTPGHVRVRGPGIESSYLHAADPDSAKVFRNGWCYPGDFAVRDSAGLVFHKGRSDEIMNFDGIMVGPGEIESVMRQYPKITDVAAFALPSPEHQDIPAAAYVASQPLQVDDLSRFCVDRLGLRAPRVFFGVDQIPKNAMGKIMRRQLTELAVKKLQERARTR